MNETAEYLDHLARRTADVVLVTVVERISDRVLLAETIGQRSKIYVSTEPGQNYKVNSRVEVALPSASRNTIGSMATAITRAPADQAGLSATTPFETEQAPTATAKIFALDPDPLIIRAGGPAGEQIITGKGFTEAASYAGQGTGADDPDVTDAEAPEVTATKVTMNIAADMASPVGTFDLVLNGVRARGALRIAKPRVATFGFFVVGNGTGASELATIIDSDPLAAPHTIGEIGAPILRFVQIAPTQFLVFVVGGGARIATVDPSTGEITVGALGTHPAPATSRAQFAINAGLIYYGDSANRYIEVDIATGAVVRVLIASTVPFSASYYHPGADSLFTAERGVANVSKVARVSGAVTTFATGAIAPAFAFMITADATNIYVVTGSDPSSGSGTIRQRAFDAMTNAPLAAAVAIATSTPRPNGDMIVNGSEVLMSLMQTNARRIHYSVAPNFTSAQAISGGDRGLGIAITPADDSIFGVPLLWRAYGIVGSGLFLGAGRVGGNDGNVFIGQQPLIPIPGMHEDSATYGLGWVSAP